MSNNIQAMMAAAGATASNQVLLPNGDLNKLSVTWDSCTMMLSPKPSSNASTELKARVFDDTVIQVRNSSLKPEQAASFVANRFEKGAVIRSAESRVATVKDFTSLCYNWTFLDYFGADGTTPVAQGVAGNLANETRFVGFEVTCNPANGMQGFTPAVPPPITTKRIVLVRLHLTAANTPQPWYQQNNANRMVAPAGNQSLASVHAANAMPTLVGWWNAVTQTYDDAAFREWFMDSYNRALLEAVIFQVRKAFVGQGLAIPPVAKLGLLRQESMVNGRLVIKTVQAHYDAFYAIAAELPRNRPLPALANMFVTGLRRDLQEEMNVNGYIAPELPVGQVFQEFDQLDEAKDQAQNAEKRLNSTDDRINQKLFGSKKPKNFFSPPTPEGQANGTTVPAYLAHTGTNAGNQQLSIDPSQFFHSAGMTAGGYQAPETPSPPNLVDPTGFFQGHTSPGLTETTYGQMYGQSSTGFAHGTQGDTNMPTEAQVLLAKSYLDIAGEEKDLVATLEKANEVQAQITALLSTAETALRRASGVSNPAAMGQIQCWGCGGPHRFLNCPKKDDPEVRKRGNDELRRLFGERRRIPSPGDKRSHANLATPTDYYSPKEITENWRELGFNTAEQAKIVACLVMRDTTEKYRKDVRINKGRPNSDPGPNTAPIYMIIPCGLGKEDKLDARVMNAMVNRLHNLNITSALPHTTIHIGNDRLAFKLKVAMDTCAGLNLGHYSYHAALKDMYPNAVAKFQDLTETGQSIRIGGVEAGAGGVVITHVITYWLPFLVQGERARISFGLSDSVAATALLGLGFIRNTRCNLNFEDIDNPSVYIGALNKTLRLTLEEPSLRPVPSRQDATHSYYAPAKSEATVTTH